MSESMLKIVDKLERTADALNFAVGRRYKEDTGEELARLEAYSECLKLLLPMELVNQTFSNFDRHLSFMKRFFDEYNFDWIMNNLQDIINYDLPYIKGNITGLISRVNDSAKTRNMLRSKKVFIAHGRDHEPMKELKAILLQLGLEPIILHEKPSGSITIIEKLEKYSNVGYAFVILTPDDKGCKSEVFDKLITEIPKIRGIGNFEIDGTETNRLMEEVLLRARQNVILEFGYFIGRLGRDRVCCLYKGDVELPSDMHGITYVPFKESIKEISNQIIKELKAAGYVFQKYSNSSLVD